MFFIKRVPKSPLGVSYCRFRARLFSEKGPKIQNVDNKNDSPKSIIEEYEGKLLYNSVIGANTLRYGYKKNAQIVSHMKNFEDKMKVALQSVQPLPLTLKYSMQEDSELSPKIINEDSDCDSKTINVSANFPFNANEASIEDVEHPSEESSIKSEIIAKMKMLNESKDNWMTHYENYENDLELAKENETADMQINYGTPDPNYPISNQPCGGCGAHLHCKDTAIPGYIPSEIFKNCFSPGGANLGSILCQRCHFLKEYNIALQVRVSPDDYPKVLKTISFNSALAVLLVDLTDFPCSIWPGIADILGPKAPVVVVGNKVDLLPKDDPKFLRRVKDVLEDHLKLGGFASANIRHVELISAKTGYGVENLISSLHRVWRRQGDIYLIGCTNVGKSSLFNLLLQSDFCKIQATDLIQRATTSPWPGTTLNLLKFPVTRFSGYRLFMRQKRLEILQKLEAKERKLNSTTLKEQNRAYFATLRGHVERSEKNQMPKSESADSFSIQGNQNMSGKTQMGIDERLPEFALGKWCYDTPGVVHPDQILHLLTTDELVKTLPRQIIRPETYCVKPGTSLFIAGLARLDYIEGPNSVRLTVFRSNALPITICDSREADSVYSELLGSELLAVPILEGDRAQKWPGLEPAKTFKVFGKNVKESSYDVVLSSAGWVAINCGLAHYEFQAWTPEKRGVHVRDSLLPKAVTLRGARIRDSVAYKKHKFI